MHYADRSILLFLETGFVHRYEFFITFLVV